MPKGRNARYCDDFSLSEKIEPASRERRRGLLAGFPFRVVVLG